MLSIFASPSVRQSLSAPGSTDRWKRIAIDVETQRGHLQKADKTDEAPSTGVREHSRQTKGAGVSVIVGSVQVNAASSSGKQTASD